MREWCSAMASAGYLDDRPESERFELPVEHALVLADDSTPAYIGGLAQLSRAERCRSSTTVSFLGRA